MPSRWCPRTVPRGLAGLAILSALWACQDVAPTLTEFPDLAYVPLSSDLAPSVRAALSSREPGDPATVRDLRAYAELEVRLQRVPSRPAASAEIFRRWRQEPSHFLWAELAIRYSDLHGRTATLDSMLAAVADTTTGAGCFLRGRGRARGEERAHLYRLAERKRAELTPLQWLLLQPRLAWLEARRGDGIAGVRRLQAALPEATRVGGPYLAASTWRHLANRLRREDRLDDALHAASVAELLARRGGFPHLEVEARLQRAGILAARRETEGALELYEECVAVARTRDSPWHVTSGLFEAAALVSDQLRDPRRALAIDQASVEFTRSLGDSLNVPRCLVNVAEDFRLLGELDSCRVYLERARPWVEAFGDPANLREFPVKEATYHLQVGNYARADSLFSSAWEAADPRERASLEADVLRDLVEQGLEFGRPDLAESALRHLRAQRPGRFRNQPHRNPRADLQLLSAELLARQGRFRESNDVLDQVAALGDLGTSSDERWALQRSRGDLAVRRGDLDAANAAYRECLALAEAMGDPERRRESLFRLAGVRLERGEVDAARALLRADPEQEYGGTFRARLSRLLLVGLAHLQAGDASMARSILERAQLLCTPHTPADLVAEIALARARTLAALEDHAPARAALEDAWTAVDRARRQQTTPELWIRGRRTARAWVEASMTLHRADPGPDLAAVTLREWQRARGGGCPGDSRSATATVWFFVGESRSFAWYDAGDVTLRELPGRDELERRVEPVLADLSLPGRPVDLRALAGLGDLLLGSVVAEWPGAIPLRIVADDLLHAVPWSALRVTTAGASRSVLDLAPVVEGPGPCGSPPRRRSADRVLALGQNAASERTPTRLREAEAEATAVAALWPPDRRTLLVGAAARWSPALATRMRTADVIHLASHAAITPGLPRYAALVLGSDETWTLTLPEIEALELDAELIYLSACEAARRPRSGTGVPDLASAFHAAGARTVLASTQRVDDAAGAFLAERFYRHWRDGLGIAESLRRAQGDVRGRPEWEHPFFWAHVRALGAGD